MLRKAERKLEERDFLLTGQEKTDLRSETEAWLDQGGAYESRWAAWGSLQSWLLKKIEASTLAFLALELDSELLASCTSSEEEEDDEGGRGAEKGSEDSKEKEPSSPRGTKEEKETPRSRRREEQQLERRRERQEQPVREERRSFLSTRRVRFAQKPGGFS